jgi:DNA-binding response OmpR family regulator
MARILLVEDDQFLSTILATHFRENGYDVVCAYDGESAVSRAIELYFDVMLLDILLPGKDGFEVISSVHAMEATKNMPVIVISNLSDEKTIQRMRELGAVQFIVKAQATPQSILAEIKKIQSA